jgi:hypothetical protein
MIIKLKKRPGPTGAVEPAKKKKIVLIRVIEMNLLKLL